MITPNHMLRCLWGTMTTGVAVFPLSQKKTTWKWPYWMEAAIASILCSGLYRWSLLLGSGRVPCDRYRVDGYLGVAEWVEGGGGTLLEAISLTERWVWMVSSWSKHQSSSSRVSRASCWYVSSAQESKEQDMPGWNTVHCYYISDAKAVITNIALHWTCSCADH